MSRGARRVVPAVLMAALAVSGLAACGDDDDGGNGGQSRSAEPSDTVTIEMSDFAYSVSGPLVAGGTLRIRNVGEEFHMLGVGRLKPGKTLADLTKALSEAGPPGGGEAGGPSTTAAATATTATTRAGVTTSSTAGSTSTSAAAGQGGGGGGQEDPTEDIIDDVGFPGSFMSPGESVELRVPNLTPGTYALVCFIPSEGDAAPHFVKGMVNQLEVVAGTAPAEPAADATYRLAPGQPVQGPTTLNAGKHTLKFEAAPGSDQLEPAIVRFNSGATYTQLDEYFTRLFEGQDPPPKGAAKQAPGQVVFGAFDLRGVTSFTMTVDLKAGSYLIVAEDTDPDNRPSPPREIINIRVS